MTSSPSGAAGSWSSDAWAPITDERPSGQPLDDDTSDATGYETPDAHWSTDVDDAPDDWGLNEESAWQHQASPEAIDEAMPGLGLSPRGLVVLSLASAAGVALLNLALTGGRISFFFDLCFVVSCLTLTMAVRRN